MKKILLLTATSATLLASSTSFAAGCGVGETGGNDGMFGDQFYFKVGGGVNTFASTKDKILRSKLKKSGAAVVTLGVGSYIMDNFRSELTADYIINPKLKRTNTTTFAPMGVGATTVTTHVTHKPTIWTLMLSGLVDVIDTENFKGFLGLGAGIAQVKDKVSITSTFNQGGVIGNIPPLTGKAKNKTNFSWKAIAGVAAPVSEGIVGELSYYWQDYGKAKGKGKGGTKFKGHNVVAAVRFEL